jgi:membrane protease YdiL (CAAX protease family)
MVDLSFKRIASVLGVLTVLIFPFADFGWLGEISRLSGEVASIAVMSAVAATLGVIAFGIRKRPLKFFHIQRFGLKDVAWMLIAIGAAFVLVTLAMPLLHDTGNVPEVDATEVPLSVALAGVLAAGILEKFIYRGFLIEELGELLRNRWLAGLISVLFFALAHGNSHYGWSVALVMPGLVGLVITILYFWRRNLPICILMHQHRFDVRLDTSRLNAWFAGSLTYFRSAQASTQVSMRPARVGAT